MAELMNISVCDVARILEVWEKQEFVDLGLTEGVVKLWQPKSNAIELIHLIENMKSNPEKYMKCLKRDEIVIKETNLNDNPYQTVSVRKISQQDTVEEILKRIVIPKSFLYRNKKDKVNSYVPMDAGSGKKPKRFFRLSSYEYPLLKSKFSRNESPLDRGYYSIKTNDKIYIQKPKKEDSRPKYRSLSTAEEFNENVIEDHLYEDLCYNDLSESKIESNKGQVKPCMSLKFPFFKKPDEVTEKKEEIREMNHDKDGHFYENNDLADMYDSVHVQKDESSDVKNKECLVVEEYLEPVNINRDYCDVCLKQKEDSLLGFIMNYFETRFGRRGKDLEIYNVMSNDGE
ncbi:unnamed protein product [Leptidea sinapis]|uniref:Uncharacterized protein n=1 Tax=Leptidea sinapis TaxID=189913 RepID=A0A5E4PYK9_9NEOP|nr:unnamed protein product [Leptidea sinapis]